MDSVFYFLRHNPLALTGIVIFTLWVVISLLAPYIAPFDPMEQHIVDRLQPPNSTYWFGTDQLGRDILSRVMYGGRLSLPAGVLVIIVAGVIGTILGGLSGFLGGWIDESVMRLTEVFMAFPTIILAMAVAAALGPKPGQRHRRDGRRLVAQLCARACARLSSASSPRNTSKRRTPSARRVTECSVAPCCPTASPRPSCWQP